MGLNLMSNKVKYEIAEIELDTYMLFNLLGGLEIHCTSYLEKLYARHRRP